MGNNQNVVLLTGLEFGAGFAEHVQLPCLQGHIDLCLKYKKVVSESVSDFETLFDSLKRLLCVDTQNTISKINLETEGGRERAVDLFIKDFESQKASLKFAWRWSS